MNITRKRIIYIDSRKRISGTDSDFTYFVDLRSDEPFDKVVVLQASIPKSYYLISNSSDRFILDENGMQAQIILDHGNYTRRSLREQVENELNLSSPNGWNYTVDIPDSSNTGETGHYIFSVTGNGGIQPSFIFNESSENVHEALGFDENSTNNFVGNSLISKDVVKLQREDTLFIHSNICSNGRDSILQEIFTFDSNDYSSIVFQTPSYEAYSKDIVTNDSNTFRFYLSDESDNIIHLNGQNLQMTLMVYKEENVLKLIKDFMKMKLLEDT